MKGNKIQFFCKEFNGAWGNNHMHVSSSENLYMQTNATDCPDCCKS